MSDTPLNIISGFPGQDLKSKQFLVSIYTSLGIYSGAKQEETTVFKHWKNYDYDYDYEVPTNSVLLDVSFVNGLCISFNIDEISKGYIIHKKMHN